ncbi:MAG: MBL fold metallo-hydrolase [Anaerolineae bacterium]|nr:MBL fold metallo-hydrolase [Anaerolineae bacterium]
MARLGNLEYHLVSDGICWVDGGGAFGLVPKPIWQKLRPPDDQNRIIFTLYSLLIRSEEQTILVDTGYGRKLTEKQQQILGLERPEGDLLNGLADLGVRPEEIDLVLNTHLHADHCGGNTTCEGERLMPTFPNAHYLIQRLEWSEAVLPNERTRATYFPDNYLPLQATGHLRIIDGPTQVTREVRTAITRGHTRAHQVVILESQGQTALFMADLASLHYHFERLAWVPGYDVEPLESIESKRTWQRWALTHDALLLFQHDAALLTGRLRADGSRFKVEPA